MKILFNTTRGLHITSVVHPLQIGAEAERKRIAYGEAYISHRIIEDHEIPADRSFRGAWVDDGQKIAVDMDVAKIIQTERMQVAALRAKPTLPEETMTRLASARTPEELKQANSTKGGYP